MAKQFIITFFNKKNPPKTGKIPVLEKPTHMICMIYHLTQLKTMGGVTLDTACYCILGNSIQVFGIIGKL